MSIQREPIREQVKRILLERILDGTYPPGERLVELQIARELNTSQGSVREALRDLEALRLVETEAYRGTRVRSISKREMHEAYQVRAVLEELAAQLAAPRLKKNVKPLETEVNAMLAAANLQDRDGLAEHNRAFHRLIVEASENTVLLHLWDLLDFETRTRITVAQPSVNLVEVAQLHQPIVDALDRGDGATAGQLLREHAESFHASDSSTPANGVQSCNKQKAKFKIP